MTYYKGEKLTKTADKIGGKNQSARDGFYKAESGKEFFIKQPAGIELFPELFAGFILKEFMACGLVDEVYHPSLICADLIQFDDGSYGLIQPKVSFTELYKIIGTGYRDGSDRNPLSEMRAGPSSYPLLTQQGQYFGLSLALMFSLLVGDYSVHSGNVVILTGAPGAPKQFSRIDWGAAFRYFAHPENNADILVPYEYQGLFNFKWLTKGYIDNYKNIAGLFSTIAGKATSLASRLNKNLLTAIVSRALSKIPADLLDAETKMALANYLFIPSFATTSFGPQGNYQQIAEIFSEVLDLRLTKIAELKEQTNEQTDDLYQSTILPPFMSSSVPMDNPVNVEDPFPATALTNWQELNQTYLEQERLFLQANASAKIVSYANLQLAFDALPSALQEEYRKDKTDYQNEAYYQQCLEAHLLQTTVVRRQDSFTFLKMAFDQLSPQRRERYQVDFGVLHTKDQNYRKLRENQLVVNTSQIARVDNQLTYLETGRQDSEELKNAACADKMLWHALTNSPNKKPFSRELVRDLLALQHFHRNKTAKKNDAEFGLEYNQSIDRFYSKALRIRLSNKTIKAQATEIIEAAHQEFHPRHGSERILADALMLVSILFFGLGLAIMAGRYLTNRTVFFSAAVTDREQDLTTQWMKAQEDLVDGNSEHTRLFNVPQIAIMA